MASVTEPLRAEHRELLPHLQELRTVADAVGHWSSARSAELDAVVRFLGDHLVPHAQAEEAVLYPAVERLEQAPHAMATMVADHGEIVARITRLGALSASLGASELTEQQANELRAELYGLWAILLLHFHKEEDVLLPILDARLTPEEARDLFSEMGHAAHSRAS